jgi:hypothetical protein
MHTKRYSVEQIVAKPREAGKLGHLVAQGSAGETGEPGAPTRRRLLLGEAAASVRALGPPGDRAASLDAGLGGVAKARASG